MIKYDKDEIYNDEVVTFFELPEDAGRLGD